MKPKMRPERGNPVSVKLQGMATELSAVAELVRQRDEALTAKVSVKEHLKRLLKGQIFTWNRPGGQFRWYKPREGL